MSKHDPQPDDRDLESAFEGLRQEERLAAPAPPSRTVSPGPHARPPALRVAGLTATAGLLLWAAWSVATGWMPSAGPPFSPATSPETLRLSWNMPTDFLLDTPGAWLLEPATGDPSAGLLGELSPKGGSR